MKIRLALSITILIAYGFASAKTKAKVATKLPTKKEVNKSQARVSQDKDTLNFEATIIEGERVKPTIFLDINIDRYSDIDSVVLMRKSFNDYHKVDKDKRPMYLGGEF